MKGEVKAVAGHVEEEMERREEEKGKRIVMRRPDDFHVHFRQGVALRDAVRWCAGEGGFARAIAMPNTKPPVTHAHMAEAYGREIMDALPQASREREGGFSALMTLYLTDTTTPDDIYAAARLNEEVLHVDEEDHGDGRDERGASTSGRRPLGKDGGIVACKLYPANATTNSSHGVSDVSRLRPVLRAMREVGLLLLVHGESTGRLVDIFDRERVFVEETMESLVSSEPGLKVVMEHITTAEAADFVHRNSSSGTLAATITPQHLLLNRNALFTPGLMPHHYCLPVLKRERHRQALLSAIASGSPYFFLGSDSAPHSKTLGKECSCGCAGIFSSPVAMPLYAKAFEEAGAPMSQLEEFSSERGADFYGLPRNEGRIALVQRPTKVPRTYRFGAFDDGTEDVVVPLCAGEELAWTIEEVEEDDDEHTSSS